MQADSKGSQRANGCDAKKLPSSSLAGEPDMIANTQEKSFGLENALDDATKIGTLSGTKKFVDSVDRGLSDYYSFHLNSASPLNLSLQGSKGDADVQLLDHSGKIVASSTNRGTDEVLKIASLSKGDYYIQVFKGDTLRKRYQSGEISRRQWASLGSSQTAQQPVPYTLQIANSNTSWLDDSFSGATNLGTLNDNISAQNSVGNTDTQDYYRFHVDRNHPFFNLSLKGLPADVDVQLLSRAGEVLASSTRHGKDDESINLSNLFDGDYYIRVFHGDTPTKYYESRGISRRQRSQLAFRQSGQQSVPYTLQISNASPSDLLPTETDIGTLDNTRVFSSSLSNKNTVDVYRFNLGPDSNFNAVLTGLNDDANFRLILDKNNNGIIDPGEEISRSAQANVHDESINVSHLAAGGYFLQIYRNGVADTHYTLKMSNTSPNNLLSNEFDVGNLNGTRLFSGSVNNSNTSDTYAFRLDNTSRFDATLTGLSDDASLYLIEDVNYNGIIDGAESSTASVYQGSVAEMVRGSLPAGSYFVQVNQYSGNTSYNLTLSTGDWFSQNLQNLQLIGQGRMFMADGSIDRKEMISLLKETENRGAIDATEISDLQKIISNLSMPDYVKSLASKVVNAGPANDRSGIGNLTGNSSSEQMEQLIEKWFLGTEKQFLGTAYPSATSKDGATTYTYQEASGSLFQNGISYQDIDQNALGDCYFLASLGAVALRTPEDIHNMFVSENDDDDDGVIDSWTVRFFNNGIADYVTVDRFLPTDASGKRVFAGWSPYDSEVFGHDYDSSNSFDSPNNELWVALAEKAYAQINESGWIGQSNTNSYQGITGGTSKGALQHITGRSTSERSVDRRVWGIGTEDVGRIADAATQNSTVVLATPALPSDNVHGRHEYILLSYDPSTERFNLYNPHGREHSVDRGELLNNFDKWYFTTT